MGVDKNGTLSRRKIKKVERKSELDAGGTCKTILSQIHVDLNGVR